MKVVLFLVALLFTLTATAQIGYEDFYSVKQLESNLRQAKTAIEQIDAAGVLAVRYKYLWNDSLKKLYLKQVFTIAQNAKDIRAMGRALWWDLYYESSVFGDWDYKASEEKANKLFQYAEQHQLLRERISGNLLLSDIKIHQDISAAEQYSLTAKNLLDQWKQDTLEKDSLRLQVYYRLAHLYIHLKEGVKTSTSLKVLLEYTLQDKDKLLKIQAYDALAQMYFEWQGQRRKAIPWFEKEYDYFKKTGQSNNLLAVVVYLSMLHNQLGNNEQVKIYLREAERLADSLNVYGNYLSYLLWVRARQGLITEKEHIKILDNNFNNHLFLPPKTIASTKANVYMWSSLDSAYHYLLLAKKLGDDNRNLWISYYELKKDYINIIPLLKETIKADEKEGNLESVVWRTKELSDVSGFLKDYKPSYEYLSKAWSLRDSLDNLTNKGKVAEMEMQKLMDLQKVSFDEQKKLQDAEQEKIDLKNRIRSFGLLGGLLVLLLIAGILWRNNRRKQKDKLKIERAYDELKATQAQLIQSEKMASLGELTAGIAHEIQNPLNFVNNFSDVNKELIDEAGLEMDKGNVSEAKTILNDIKENEKKINHHGKRADAIVKGMLQHSRTSSGQKEPTDINALVDEYLRLAYHGLRAKDKSFNVTMKTDFDQTIGNVNIIPQDIGRVVLNLINNAFYAASLPSPEKIGTGIGGISEPASNKTPTIWVSTKKDGNKIFISVRDNGPGIPSNILDKIFQPFFTTKPTGQGTGLGLSLAYDIVKAHGGEITVESTEARPDDPVGRGKGSQFSILLPAKINE